MLYQHVVYFFTRTFKTVLPTSCWKKSNTVDDIYNPHFTNVIFDKIKVGVPINEV